MHRTWSLIRSIITSVTLSVSWVLGSLVLYLHYIDTYHALLSIIFNTKIMTATHQSTIIQRHHRLRTTVPSTDHGLCPQHVCLIINYYIYYRPPTNLFNGWRSAHASLSVPIFVLFGSSLSTALLRRKQLDNRSFRFWTERWMYWFHSDVFVVVVLKNMLGWLTDCLRLNSYSVLYHHDKSLNSNLTHPLRPLSVLAHVFKKKKC